MVDKQSLIKKEICKECKKPFRKTNYNKLFCSKKCCSKFHNRNKDIDIYLVGDYEIEDDYQLVEEMFQTLIICPRCKKPLSSYWKKSKRNTKRGEDKDRYRCLRCGHYFTLYSLDFRMQHPESEIKKFIELIKSGFSEWDIVRNNLMQISKMTAYRWKKKYCSTIAPNQNSASQVVNDGFNISLKEFQK